MLECIEHVHQLTFKPKSKLKVPRHAWYNGKDTYLYGFQLLGTLNGIAILPEKDEIRV
jgi:hypothetical protein